MLLTIYKERLDGLNVVTISNEFSYGKDEKLVFVTFRSQD